MEVYYINILLFALPLNILANTHKKTSITHHTPKIPTARSLCECELYAPVNYDNDAEMKSVMQQFEDRTSQRFHEYDERIQEKRMQCKERCDKEIQKIILKDKLEKQMAQHFDTLHTDIQSDAIPTCVCEKSIADKVEKGCLTCGYGLGTVAPTVGLIGSVAVHVWKPKALAAAIEAALKANAAEIAAAGEAARIPEAIKTVIESLKSLDVHNFWPEMSNSIGTAIPYNDITKIASFINEKKSAVCMNIAKDDSIEAMCDAFNYNFGISNADGHYLALPLEAVPKKVTEVVEVAEGVAKAAAKDAEAAKTAIIKAAEEKTIEAASTQLYGAIGYSVLAIIIIVLIMVIIYKILRYRRKKKMKKKLKYIKLLEE
ncbi:rifin [Plasmodium reichenowi]|uniref:Rifin n=1 Tax=Plasmodium reichenowi TaxID=5854 RepID=A0A060RPX4_PLARE|nr:rifin [Plasmodium reichenowi]